MSIISEIPISLIEKWGRRISSKNTLNFVEFWRSQARRLFRGLNWERW